MQTENRFFDDLARLMGGAAGMAQGLTEEATTAMKSQMERVAAQLDLVRREEFDAMRELAQAAREETLILQEQVTQLRAELDALKGKSGTAG